MLAEEPLANPEYVSVADGWTLAELPPWMARRFSRQPFASGARA